LSVDTQPTQDIIDSSLASFYIESKSIMRPCWSDYFLGLAKVISQRSHDIHTQHGCVITDKNHRILGVGYNGFPKGLKDEELPTDRPNKYPWMIHAERNALSNCVIRPDNATAYVTGQSCNDCIMALWQEGVDTVYMIDGHGTHLFDEKQQKIFDLFIQMSGMEIKKISPDLSWLKNLCGVL
jgi:dCMP deaminase